MPFICYLCEEESIGYFYGGYFCEECEKIKKLVEFLGARKITESVRFKMEKVEGRMRRHSTPEVSFEEEPVSKNTRSKKKNEN